MTREVTTRLTSAVPNVLMWIDGVPKLVTHDECEKILGRCHRCGYVFGVNQFGHPEHKCSIIVGCSLRFICCRCAGFGRNGL